MKEQKTIALLPGDGIGPEVTAQAVKALEKVCQEFGRSLDFKEGLIGAAAIDATGDPFPDTTEALCKSSDAILFGAIGDPRYDNDPNATIRPEQGLLRMRKSLGLYCNIRPVTTYAELYDISPLKNKVIEGVDFVVYRELTGGMYFGEPRGRTEDGRTAFDSCVYSVHEIRRIAKLAFLTAQRRRGKLTMVDKANVLATSRLWRETVEGMSPDYPEVDLEFMFVDNAAMKMIQQPTHFDVVLTENLFGDILTDEASVITGSMGMLPSASVGDGLGLFEPIHGSYPEAAGMGRANPFAAILSAAMLLEESFGWINESRCIADAVKEIIRIGICTEDLQPSSKHSTDEVGDEVAAAIHLNVPA